MSGERYEPLNQRYEPLNKRVHAETPEEWLVRIGQGDDLSPEQMKAELAGALSAAIMVGEPKAGGLMAEAIERYLDRRLVERAK